MNQPKKKPAALTARGAVSSPYTVPGERPRGVVNSTEAAELRALDRKLTDGLNLVHGEFAVLREERREDRKELRAEIAEVDARAAQRTADLEAALRAEIARVDERAAQRDERAAQRTADLEAALRAEIAKVDERAAQRDERAAQRTTDLETAIRELTAKVSTSLERGSGTRQFVLKLVSVLALLVIGGLLRPFFERVVSVLSGG